VSESVWAGAIVVGYSLLLSNAARNYYRTDKKAIIMLVLLSESGLVVLLMRY
jgi:hypothetical protein